MAFVLRSAAGRGAAGAERAPGLPLHLHLHPRAATLPRAPVVVAPSRCSSGAAASAGHREFNEHISHADVFLDPKLARTAPVAEGGAARIRRHTPRPTVNSEEPTRQLVIFEDLAEQLLGEEKLVKLPAAEAVQLVNFTNKNVDRLVSRLGKSRELWRRVLVLHEWLLLVGHQPDNRLCTSIMNLCCSNGEPLRSLALYDWMQGMQAMGTPGPHPNIYTYTAAMRAALSAQQPRRAVQVFHDSRENGCAVDTHLLCAAIEAHVRDGSPAEAVDMFMHYRKLVKPSLQMYNAAMRAATLDNRGDTALQLWEELQAQGITPSIQTYTSAMSACAAERDSERAYLLYRQSIHAGIKADCRMLTALITALGAENHWRQATKVLQFMLRSGITPSVYTYSAVIGAMVTSGELTRALSVFHRMQTPGWGPVVPNAYIYSRLLTGFARQRRFEEAEELFHGLLDTQGLLEEYLHWVAVATGKWLSDDEGDGDLDLEAELLSGRGHGAEGSSGHRGLKVHAQEPRLNLRPHPSWLEAAAGGEGPRRSSQPLLNDVVVGAMISVCERCGKWEHALALLRWASSGGLPGVQTNGVMLNSALSALGKAGQWEEARQQFDAHSAICDQVSRETMVVTYGQAGKVREAELMLRQIIEGGEIPRDYAFCGIIAAYRVANKPRRALQVRDRMRSLNITPSVHVYNELLALCQLLKMWDKALELRQAMKREDVVPNRTTHDLLAIISEKGVQNVEGQQAAAAAWSAAAYVAGALLFRTGVL